MFLSLLLAAALAGQNAVPDRAAAERLARAGSFDEALERFRQLALADPDNIEVRLWIGRVHVWMGHPERAESIFRGVLVLEPRNVEALASLGSVLATLGRRGEADALLGRAEELAPDNADVLAAQGRAQRMAGRGRLAVAYYRRALLLNPADPDVRQGLEATERLHGHRLEGTFLHDAFNAAIPSARQGDLALNLRATDHVRLVVQAQTQSKFSRTETRAGGGIEWRARPGMVLRTQAMSSPAAELIPRVDAGSEVELGHGRAELVGSIRISRFTGANLWTVSPGLTFWLSEGVAVGARYYRSTTTFARLERAIGSNSGMVRLRVRARPRLWLDAAYARGIENFDTLSADRLGHFLADTVSGGARIELATLTSFGASCDYQSRSNGTRMLRLSVSTVQRF